MKAPFIYFFPNTGQIPEEFVGRFETEKLSVNKRAVGPCGSTKGLMVSPFSSVECFYNDREQNWQKIGDNAWLGTNKDVDPETFLREKVYNSYPVELADRKEWLMPIAYPLVPSCSLPIIYRWKWCENARKNQMYHDIDKRFKEVSEKALQIGIGYFNQGVESRLNNTAVELDFEMSDEEAAEFLHKAININYDINFLEFQSLGVYSPESFEKMLYSLIDQPGIESQIDDAVYREVKKFILKKKDLNQPLNSQLQTSLPS
ncbi:MAG: hypothetical protein ACPG5T_00470 [Endozoicomonas sp.]